MEQITVCIIIVYLCFIRLDSNIINIVIKYYNYSKLFELLTRNGINLHVYVSSIVVVCNYDSY